jgi:F420-0:gamma-glutamyl ligase
MDEMMVEFQKIIEESSNKLKVKEQDCLTLAEKTVSLKEIVEGSIVEKENFKMEIDELKKEVVLSKTESEKLRINLKKVED